jgi:hypothetical protein
VGRNGAKLGAAAPGLDSSGRRNYSAAMTEHREDKLARLHLKHPQEEPLDADTIAALDEAEAEIERGERASPEDVKAFWRAHRL